MASKTKTNFGKKRKKKHIISRSGQNDDEFTLKNVQELGGDEVGCSIIGNFKNKCEIHRETPRHFLRYSSVY